MKMMIAMMLALCISISCLKSHKMRSTNTTISSTACNPTVSSFDANTKIITATCGADQVTADIRNVFLLKANATATYDQASKKFKINNAEKTFFNIVVALEKKFYLKEKLIGSSCTIELVAGVLKCGASSVNLHDHLHAGLVYKKEKVSAKIDASFSWDAANNLITATKGNDKKIININQIVRLDGTTLKFRKFPRIF